MMEFFNKKNSVYRIGRLFSIKCTNNKSFHIEQFKYMPKKNNFFLLSLWISIDNSSKRRGIWTIFYFFLYLFAFCNIICNINFIIIHILYRWECDYFYLIHLHQVYYLMIIIHILVLGIFLFYIPSYHIIIHSTVLFSSFLPT